MRTQRFLLAVCVGLVGSLALATGAVAGEDGSYTVAELETVKTALDADANAKIPGTSWAVDADTGRVVVSYDDTVTGDRLTALESATARHGAAIRFERLPGVLEPADSRTVGGNAIFGGITRCSLGFNAVSPGGYYYFITAGHCTNDSYYWKDNDKIDTLGYRVASYYNTGSDYGIVRYTNTTIAKYGTVESNYDGTYQDITRSGWAHKNQYTCRSGSTTGRRCGYVQDTCATVTYRDGTTLYCMVKTSACHEGGDSGGPMWAGTVALGVLSGGIRCRSSASGPSYFEAVQRIVQNHGIAVY